MKKKRSHWIPVSTGLLRQNNQILVGQRPQEGSLPGIWEFPGGKIELGETPEQALARELHEELSIHAEVGRLIHATTHSYNDVGIILTFYEVNYWKGQPKPVHHTDIKWVSINDLASIDLPEANLKVISQIQDALLKHSQ